MLQLNNIITLNNNRHNKLFILDEQHDAKKCPKCRRLTSGLIFYQIPQIVINFCESTMIIKINATKKKNNILFD